MQLNVIFVDSVRGAIIKEGGYEFCLDILIKEALQDLMPLGSPLPTSPIRYPFLPLRATTVS